MNTFTPQAITQTVTGTSQDFVNADGLCHLIVAAGNTAGNSPTLDVKVQESANGTSGFTDITGASITQITTATAPTPQIVQFQRTLRYLRTIATVGGTGSPNYYGVALLLEQKKYGAT